MMALFYEGPAEGLQWYNVASGWMLWWKLIIAPSLLPIER